jgi:hypothetical protein
MCVLVHNERKFESGYISVRGYHSLGRDQPPAAAGTHATVTPDADGDPEADMDTSVPHHHDPTPHILDRPRFASSQKTPHPNPTRATSNSASLRMVAPSAGSTRASPPSTLPLPPFPMMAPIFESALSSPLSRSRSPSSSPCQHASETLALVMDDIDIHRTYDHACAIRHGASPSTRHATSSPSGTQVILYFG